MVSVGIKIPSQGSDPLAPKRDPTPLPPAREPTPLAPGRQTSGPGSPPRIALRATRVRSAEAPGEVYLKAHPPHALTKLGRLTLWLIAALAIAGVVAISTVVDNEERCAVAAPPSAPPIGADAGWEQGSGAGGDWECPEVVVVQRGITRMVALLVYSALAMFAAFLLLTRDHFNIHWTLLSCLPQRQVENAGRPI